MEDHMATQANQSVDADRVVRARHALAAPSVARPARRSLGLVSLALLLAAVLATSAQAASVGLGTTDSFSVLGGSTVTNTGPSTLAGDLGVSPGTAVTGFPPGTVGGTIHANDAVARQAQADLVTAYNDAARRRSTATVSGDLAGRTLSSGVYTSASSLGLSGDLTLDAKGDPNAVFIFQAGSTLTTGSGSRVLLIGGAQACNVFWQVGSSATIGTSTAFTGNILALTSISLTRGATLDGRALARNGAVTLDTNTVTHARCATTGGGTTGGTGGTTGGTGGTTGGTGGTTGGTGGTTGGGTTGGTGGTPIGLAPMVITSPASHIGSDDVRLGGELRPGGAPSTYYFQFGPSKRYGHHTPSGHAAPSAKAFPVRAHVSRLRPGTIYHYRLVGVGPGGRKTYGADRTFRTRPRPARHSPARPPHTRAGFTG